MPNQRPKPPGGGRRKRRTAHKLCACGCGETVRPLIQRGRIPKYINHVHRQRAHQARLDAKKPASS